MIFLPTTRETVIFTARRSSCRPRLHSGTDESDVFLDLSSIASSVSHLSLYPCSWGGLGPSDLAAGRALTLQPQTHQNAQIFLV